MLSPEGRTSKGCAACVVDTCGLSTFFEKLQVFRDILTFNGGVGSKSGNGFSIVLMEETFEVFLEIFLPFLLPDTLFLQNRQTILLQSRKESEKGGTAKKE